VAALLSTSVMEMALARTRAAHDMVSCVALAATLVALSVSIAHVVIDGTADSVAALPLGLPWLGAHFRVDALASVFLTMVNLAGAAACLYGLGYGRHESPAKLLHKRHALIWIIVL